MCFITKLFGGKKKDLKEQVADLQQLAGIHSQQIGELMSTLDEVQAEVSRQNLVLDDVRAKSAAQDAKIAELEAVIAGGGLSAENQAKVDAIMAELKSNSAEMQEALGTPPV